MNKEPRTQDPLTGDPPCRRRQDPVHAHGLGYPLALLIMVSALGCSRHYRVSETPKNLTDRKVTVRQRDGSAVQAYATQTETGVVWRTFDGDQLIPTDAIVSVDHSRRGRAVLQGMGIGVLSGALLGAVIGYSGGDDPSCVCLFSLSAGDKAVLGGLVGGLLGVPLGFLVGVIKGSNDHYDFVRDGPPGFSVHPTPHGVTTTLSWTF